VTVLTIPDATLSDKTTEQRNMTKS